MRSAFRLRPSGFVLAFAAFLLFAASAPQRQDDRGKLIFDTVCSGCHSLTPPAVDAPPMLMVAEHYVQAKGTEEAAMAAMKDWIPNPSVEKSLLPAHAIEKFGLMDPLPLPADDLDAVVAYIFAERAKAGSMPGMQHGQTAPPDTSHGCPGGQCRMHQQQGQGMMQHGQMQEGQGMQHGQMQHGDSTAAAHQCPMHQQQGQGMMQHGQMQQGEGAAPAHQCPMHQQQGQGMMQHGQMQEGQGMQHGQMQEGQGMQHGQMQHGDGAAQAHQCPMHQQQGHGMQQGMMQHGQMQQGEGAAQAHQCPMHQSSTDSTKTMGAGQQHRHGQHR